MKIETQILFKGVGASQCHKLINIVNIFRYHVPHSWLKPTGNLLVVFEEWGGDPNGIFLDRRDVDTVCADIYEWQPTLMNWHMQASGKVNKPLRPKAHLSCGAGQKISKIKFASFGTPEGACGSFHEGACHAHNSYDAFERVRHYIFALTCILVV